MVKKYYGSTFLIYTITYVKTVVIILCAYFEIIDFSVDMKSWHLIGFILTMVSKCSIILTATVQLHMFNNHRYIYHKKAKSYWSNESSWSSHKREVAGRCYGSWCSDAEFGTCRKFRSQTVPSVASLIDEAATRSLQDLATYYSYNATSTQLFQPWAY